MNARRGHGQGEGFPADAPHVGALPATPGRASGGDLFGTVPLTTAAITSVVLLPWLGDLPPQQAALALLHAALAAAGVARAAYPVFRPVALVTFVFTLSWLGLAPVYQLSTGKAAWRDNAVLFGPSTTTALILLLIATAALYVGFFRRGRGVPAPLAASTSGLNPPRTVCLLYVLACLALSPAAIASAGGVSALFSSRADRNEALLAQGISLEQVGGAEIALLGTIPGALATAATYLLLIRILAQYRKGRWKDVDAADAALLTVAFTLTVIFANPFTNTRGLSAAALGSLVILMLQPRSRRAGLVMAVAMIIATLVAYPAANAFRGTDEVSDAQGLEFLASKDFDGFQQSINTVSFVNDLGHSAGTYTASGLLYFVPRSAWAEKERPASIDVAARRGYAFTNLSLPLHAEAYLDFGPVGMALLMFLIASAGRRCDLDWAGGVQSRAALMAPYACLATLSIIRGPIGSNGPVYLTNIGLIAIGLLLARRSTPAPSGTPDAPDILATCSTDPVQPSSVRR